MSRNHTQALFTDRGPFGTSHFGHPRGDAVLNWARIARRSFLIAAFAASAASTPLLAQDAKDLPQTRQFITKYCADCHDDQTLKAGLDLTHLAFKLEDEA